MALLDRVSFGSESSRGGEAGESRNTSLNDSSFFFLEAIAILKGETLPNSTCIVDERAN
jgi:hypothetical protein